MSNGQTLTLRAALESRITRAFAEVEDVARTIGYEPRDVVMQQIAELQDIVWGKAQYKLADIAASISVGKK